MALTSAGLTDIGMGAGFTLNFHVQYEDSLPNQANLIAHSKALLAVLENEFSVTTGWFNTPAGNFGTGNRQVVNLNRSDGSGANNSGYGSAINLDPQGSNNNLSDASERVKMVFMNEWVEILMSLTNGKWNAGDSNGEGLSQYAGIVRFQAGHYSYYNSWVNQWLNQQPRQDWVNTTEGTDGNAISFGCSLAFIYYLNAQLGFSIYQIIAAYSGNLATAYQTLTGDNSNPYPYFAEILENAYPSSATALIPGPVSDNPYPLGMLSFWAEKNSFGADEVRDRINHNGGFYPGAFWLMVDGFSKNTFNSLGITIPQPTGAFANMPGITIIRSVAYNIDFENNTHSAAPQRIRIPYDIIFTNATVAAFPADLAHSPAELELDAFISVGGNRLLHTDAAILFELTAGANPYFNNINPAQNNVFYLSQDLRVFTATPALNPIPVAGIGTTPSFASDSIAGAYDYIQRLITYLNDNYNDTNASDPFNTILPGDYTGDSSVSPSFFVFKNYNFAVARVRLQGSSGSVGAANNAKVFFRLWSTQSADTDYQVASTYPFNPDAAGLPGSPRIGTDHHTIPFYATPDASDYNAGGANTRTITIDAGKDTRWAYFGCFLNLYDNSYLVDGQQVQHWLQGTHSCLVAQIAYDDAPIKNSNTIILSPENCDKLAQRNLQVTHSDNPGSPDTHRIPQTFDIRPSKVLQQILGSLLNYPDELMIDWGNTPLGSVASIYWPQVNAMQVLQLASKLYASQLLWAADANTIQCKVDSNVTYIPIPVGSGDNFAGLFTVDLPPTVVKGQEFNIIVRRVSTRRNLEEPRQEPSILHSPGITTDNNDEEEGGGQNQGQTEPKHIKRVKNWRYVVGTFQIKIPVSTKHDMLFPEENTLAIMKWRLQAMSPTYRWYPVLKRYISYLSARVDGLGGDANSIKPSLEGVPPRDHIIGDNDHKKNEVTGKVCEVIYNCFGDFEGFVLIECCDKKHIFKSCEKGIEEMVLRVCKERLLVSVFSHEKTNGKICQLIIRC